MYYHGRAVVLNHERVLVTEKNKLDSYWLCVKFELYDGGFVDCCEEGWLEAHDEFGEPTVELARGACRYTIGQFCEVSWAESGQRDYKRGMQPICSSI